MEINALRDTVERIGQLEFDTRYPLDDREKAVFDVLKYCLGEANAVSRPRLAAMTGIPDRRARETVESLRKNHRLPIGANERGGYYLCVTPEEFTRNAKREYKRGRAVMANLSVYMKSERLAAALGQVELALQKKAEE